jgi:hypothetical protein
LILDAKILHSAGTATRSAAIVAALLVLTTRCDGRIERRTVEVVCYSVVVVVVVQAIG